MAVAPEARTELMKVSNGTMGHSAKADGTVRVVGVIDKEDMELIWAQEGGPRRKGFLNSPAQSQSIGEAKAMS